MRSSFSLLVVAGLVGLVGIAGADPASAKKHNNAGMKAYSKGEYEEAKGLFEKAIKEDPGFVKAHYNRASMSALLGDVAVMKEEFDWLKASKDPEAARVLTKSKTDLDFAAISLNDEARAILGFAPVADTPFDQLLLGYGGWWAGVDEGMMQGWIEMQFAAKGKVKGRDHSGEEGKWFPWSGKWKADGRKVVIAIGKGKTMYELKECDEMSGIEGSLCLVREDGGAYVVPGKH